jgi:hypothetical protein
MATKPTKKQLHEALKRLCDAIGGMPHDWPDQATRKAWSDAVDLLEGPDAFTERFMNQERRA